MSSQPSTSSSPAARASSESPGKPSPESFKGRSARKSTAAKPKAKTPDFDFSDLNDPDVAAATRAQRARDNLQFSNPGQKNSDIFTSSASSSKRRNAFEKAMQRNAVKEQESPAPSKPVPKQPSCDCIRPECKGCFPPCKKCGSRRCARYCQVNRGWTVVECVIPGSKSKPLRNEMAVDVGSGSESGSSSD
uniref:ARF7EP_C domain-containing protein n=1 Tax=Panagrellus redivivus TaxID=6233 RepID=A0A7E4ZSV6_PANRE